ncbi:MAG: dihydroorotate dehydrogenase electron transfer subunit [Planctomycetota bacterium]
MKMPVKQCFVDSYELITNQDLGEGWFRLDIHAPEIASQVRAGQFVQVRVGPDDTPLIRRPFSVYDVNPAPGATATELSLLVQKVGPGTTAMSRLRPGDPIQLMGPLGHPMPRPELAENGVLFLVGGGIGVAPLYLYSRELAAEKSTLDHRVLLGARRKSLLIGMEAFEKLGTYTSAATDDGSAGHTGNVIELLAQELASLAEGTSVAGIGCGPHGMNQALRDIAAQQQLDFWISLENYMPCGFGACFGCVIPGPEDQELRYRRVCVEGPCFPVHELPARL